ncbi:DUF4242 domain-containing protein [Massilia endophytica]|uniref:DUF4242 domain-containing protein n=1 Tax=Massilia endophytica TaxID=2899220 RepID=UPI001E43EBEE|nr:DUF4242 domain-containing protein [Massilia endophytica]UGQ45430.1 DUF4242 domain-containing protein [Massilia endophytica]
MLKKFVIERDVPGIGSNTPDGFCAIAKTSNAALDALGNDIQWQETFVVADKTYCVYLAKDADIIRKHAETSGFPANRISEVVTVIDPSSAAA